MSEISKYEAQVKKMQALCDEHDLCYAFKKNQYPLIFILLPSQDVDAQMDMLADESGKNYRSPDARMIWIFESGELSTKVSGGTFTISKVLRTKIESILLKMISYWQQYFFRDVIEKRSLKQGMMPVIDEAEANDLPDGAEPLEEYEEDPDEAADEELLAQAAALVRAENKASTALLQRRLNIGYARAARLMDELEEQGVVGPYKGAEPREVLPADEPEDEANE